MKTTLMVCSGEPEVMWNAFRMGNLMLEQMDDVTMFLNGPAVRYGPLSDNEFPIADLAKIFTLSEGVLLA
jgi:uncharacterized protein involved in oxidation of intracellular sulfur